MLPSTLLRQLRVDPTERIEFELANGTIVEREIGETLVRLNGRAVRTIVVFGDEGRALLGAYTLEGLRLGVDPMRMRLVPVRGLLMALYEHPVKQDIRGAVATTAQRRG